ncbi:MAG: hypothetical protein H7A13_07490 [Pseudomonadales bacterium]|nr:hypothetical protein [Pseudomonadales bacterium]
MSTPSFTVTAWPSPARFALALTVSLALTLCAVWLWGTALIERLIPVVGQLLGLIDDRFGILFLGVEHDWQDTVVRLRVNVIEPFVMGGQQVEALPEGWLEVTTTTGAVLQPLIIASATGLALPGGLAARLTSGALATLLAFGFLLLDLPLTLHAYVWDMFIDHLEPDRFSPLMQWHQFLHSGGRFGVALLLGLGGWCSAGRLSRQ